MTELSDFRRIVHEPLEAKFRLAQQDVAGVQRVMDDLQIPLRNEAGDLLRPTGRAEELRKRVHAVEREAIDDLGAVVCDCDEDSTCLPHRILGILGIEF